MSQVSEIRRKLDQLARNLWWSWNPEAIATFRDVNPELWREVNHNPVAFFEQLGDESWAALTADEVAIARIDRVYSQLQRYLDSSNTWGDTHAGALFRRPVAYFSAEFGIHESLPIYSGGLGVLSGDHVKSASDLGIPFLGVGLFYREGYFHQRIDRDGRQEAVYVQSDPAHLALELLRDQGNDPVIVEIPLPEGPLQAQVWVARVGRARLLLLDAAVDGPREVRSPESGEGSPAQAGDPGAPAGDDLRDLSARLYGGDERVRLRQEMLLGIGGIRALLAAGNEPGVIHLNEGHSAFAVLELARTWAERDGVPFWDAFAEAAARTVFTTHTPVAAGHDRFQPDMFEENMRAYRHELGLDREALLSLGRVNPADRSEPFCMTVLALKGSRKVNGVSALHGRVSRRMWRDLYPGRRLPEVPIGHITNGIHVGSWLAPEMYDLYVRHFGWHWPQRLCEPELWAAIDQVDDDELWDVHQILKMRLVRFVRRRLTRQRRRWGASEAEIQAVERILDPDKLLVGFARRFATYKRADLVLHQFDRFVRLVERANRPVQFVFSGKAHPHDAGGQELIRKICELTMREELAGRIVFLEDYDINVGRHLVQGVDLWLNNPRRPMEASGTSGQKVVLNGGLNLSVLDGWWPEAYDGRNGFAIETPGQAADPATQDRRDAADLMRTLELEVVPLYYHRNEHGNPVGWIARMKRAIRTMGWRFNTDRMVRDYCESSYLPAADAVTRDMSMA